MPKLLIKEGPLSQRNVMTLALCGPDITVYTTITIVPNKVLTVLCFKRLLHPGEWQNLRTNLKVELTFLNTPRFVCRYFHFKIYSVIDFFKMPTSMYSNIAQPLNSTLSAGRRHGGGGIHVYASKCCIDTVLYLILAFYFITEK